MKIVILDGYTTTGRSYEIRTALKNQAATDDNNAISELSWLELEKLGELRVYDRTSPNETVERAADADIVLTNKVILDRDKIAMLPRLKYIGVLATGYNVVDLKAAQEKGIIVTNVPAYSTESVAQMVFAHLLTAINRTEHYAAENRNGRWTANTDFCYMDFPYMELAGKTFGIVGLGNIGTRVAQIAIAFGMNVKAVTSKSANDLPNGIAKADFATLFSTSDVLSLHCPLTNCTRHIINAKTIAQMKPTAILINTSRGPLIDDNAVAEALHNGRLKAFCADVLTAEPPTAYNPLLNQPNAYITPHIAWASTEARARLIKIATENVRTFINGKTQNIVAE